VLPVFTEFQDNSAVFFFTLSIVENDLAKSFRWISEFSIGTHNSVIPAVLARLMSGNQSHCACGNISVFGSPSNGPVSCQVHFHLTGPLPIFQVHRGAISVAILSKIEVRSSNHHRLDVNCLACGSRLLVYASRRGAFCQFSVPLSRPLSGSLSTDAFLAPVQASVPASIRPLFRHRDIQAAVAQAKEFDATDYEVMFARSTNAIVGSYSMIGQFVAEPNWFVLPE
jgi:hypothetical protein